MPYSQDTNQPITPAKRAPDFTRVKGGTRRVKAYEPSIEFLNAHGDDIALCPQCGCVTTKKLRTEIQHGFFEDKWKVFIKCRACKKHSVFLFALPNYELVEVGL